MKGFSFLEITFVLIIIVLLAITTSNSYSYLISQARGTKMVVMANALANTIEMYAIKHKNRYPNFEESSAQASGSSKTYEGIPTSDFPVIAQPPGIKQYIDSNLKFINPYLSPLESGYNYTPVVYQPTFSGTDPPYTAQTFSAHKGEVVIWFSSTVTGGLTGFYNDNLTDNSKIYSYYQIQAFDDRGKILFEMGR